jgi:citrate synthase
MKSPGSNARRHPVIVTETAVNADLTDGYRVQELCRRHSFEEVAYLAWHGRGRPLAAHDRPAERLSTWNR